MHIKAVTNNPTYCVLFCKKKKSRYICRRRNLHRGSIYKNKKRMETENVEVAINANGVANQML